MQIKGINSGFVETETGREGEDPIHIHVTSVVSPAPSCAGLTAHQVVQTR